MEQYSIEGAKVVRRLIVGPREWLSAVDNLADPKLSSAASAWWQSFLRGGAVYRGSVVPAPVVRSVDAFCGCGGLTLGAAQAAIAAGRSLESVAAIDVDGDGLAVHRSNFDTKHLLESNASSLVDFHVSGSNGQSRFAYEPEILDPNLAAEVGKIDLFLAGPPAKATQTLTTGPGEKIRATCFT